MESVALLGNILWTGKLSTQSGALWGIIYLLDQSASFWARTPANPAYGSPIFSLPACEIPG
jgi:hypothetical protein